MVKDCRAELSTILRNSHSILSLSVRTNFPSNLYIGLVTIDRVRDMLAQIDGIVGHEGRGLGAMYKEIVVRNREIVTDSTARVV